MKPKRIFLVRHEESMGNVDPKVYESTPDWKIPLTDKGLRGAQKVSEKLFKKIGLREEITRTMHNNTFSPRVAIYCSPWYRTRQTAAPFVKDLHEASKVTFTPTGHYSHGYTYKEDPRLREQEWGNFKEEPWSGKIGRDRKRFGTFFYRMPFGESGADVFDRISTFNETLHRDFRNENFPENVVIFSHGLTIRIFLMRWFHWSVEEFQNIRNPRNGQIIEMRRPLEDSKYKLITKLSKRDPAIAAPSVQQKHTNGPPLI